MVGLLTAIVLAVFAIFQFASRGFSQAVVRQGVLGESQLAANRLRFDLSATHFRSINAVQRSVTLADGTVVSRDAVACAGLSNWRDPANFFPNRLPRWNRYVVYYATRDDEGSLFRQEVDVGVLAGPIAYADLGLNISDLHDTNANVVRSTLLSKNVLDFRVGTDQQRQVVNLALKLRQLGGKKVNSNQPVDETHETVFSVATMNTYPNL